MSGRLPKPGKAVLTCHQPYSLHLAIKELSHEGLILEAADSKQIVCRSAVREAVIATLDHDTCQIRFDWLAFRLYYNLPELASLFTTWNDWTSYGELLKTLIQIHEKWSKIVRPPIMMCEIMRGCAW